MLKILLTFLILFNQAKADYLVDGKITGCDCWFGIICKCGLEIVTIKKGGEYYEMNKKFSKVDEYKEFENYSMCHVRINKGLMFRGFSDDGFYKKNEEGKLKKINTDSLSFRCIEETEN